MGRVLPVTLVTIFATTLLSATGPVGTAAPAPGGVVIVQAVPGASPTVAVDGKAMGSAVAVGKVLGPFDLEPGKHMISFTDESNDVSVETEVAVKSGGSTDVVLHEPAAPDGAPVVNRYTTPTKPIGPGKARVLLAHTATVPPADVQVDGTVVFTNIANGEYAQADVPAGSHRVALFPTGRTSDPILGPLDLSVAEGTITMVYAVGNPSQGSMDVIVHRADLEGDGSVVPDEIHTGDAGLAARIEVLTFGSHRSGT